MTRTQDRSLLKLWSQKVRERDEHCQWIYETGLKCQAKEVLHAHHFIGRRGRSTRWYLPNGYSLCPKHHTFGVQSAEQSAPIFIDRVRQEDGPRYRDLLRKANIIAQNIDPKKVKAHLEGQLTYYL